MKLNVHSVVRYWAARLIKGISLKDTIYTLKTHTALIVGTRTKPMSWVYQKLTRWPRWWWKVMGGHKIEKCGLVRSGSKTQRCFLNLKQHQASSSMRTAPSHQSVKLKLPETIWDSKWADDNIDIECKIKQPAGNHRTVFCKHQNRMGAEESKRQLYCA